VWIVDPLDGTKEFVQHIPEWCVCIALVEDGVPVVGVSFNPITDELFAAARGRGLTVNGSAAHTSATADLRQARILASRSEDKRGAGTFSLTPKDEWDVCAGAALIQEGGGRMSDCYGQPLRFNSEQPLLPGIIATNGPLFDPIRALIAETSAPGGGGG
jgi:myo-inositol-1(or 4)-monophosphatase